MSNCAAPLDCGATVIVAAAPSGTAKAASVVETPCGRTSSANWPGRTGTNVAVYVPSRLSVTCASCVRRSPSARSSGPVNATRHETPPALSGLPTASRAVILSVTRSPTLGDEVDRSADDLLGATTNR